MPSTRRLRLRSYSRRKPMAATGDLPNAPAKPKKRRRAGGSRSSHDADRPMKISRTVQKADEDHASDVECFDSESTEFSRNILEPDLSWDAMFARLEKHRRNYGCFPASLEQIESSSLRRWIWRQHDGYASYQLRPDHLERLKRLGFPFPKFYRNQNAVAVDGGSYSIYEGNEYHIPEEDEHRIGNNDGRVQPSSSRPGTRSQSDDVSDSDQSSNSKISDSHGLAVATEQKKKRARSRRSGNAVTKQQKALIAKVKSCLPSPDESQMNDMQLADRGLFLEMCERLKLFIEKYGDARVPQRYADDPDLALWVRLQRRHLVAGTIHQDQFQTLIDMNFIWASNKAREPVPLELDYVKGILLPPGLGTDEVRRRPSTEKEADRLLRRKLGQERRPSGKTHTEIKASLSSSNKVKSHLTSGLRKIGMYKRDKTLSPPLDSANPTDEQKFSSLVKRLRAYALAHGDTRVPEKYFKDSELGHWASELRQKRKIGTLQQHHVEMLCSMGFAWDLDSLGDQDPDLSDSSSESLALGSDDKIPTSSNDDQSAFPAPTCAGLGDSSSSRRIAVAYPSRERIDPCNYENLDAMMLALHRNNYLKEHALTPFHKRHPELIGVHDGLITDPIDLAMVAERVKHREYKKSCDVFDDINRVFDQSIEVFSQPNVEGAHVALSIMTHLKEFVVNMWLEFMVPSDASSLPSELPDPRFEERTLSRELRMQNSGRLPLPRSVLLHVCAQLNSLIASDCVVDGLDADSLSALVTGRVASDLKIRLQRLSATLAAKAGLDAFEYSMGHFYEDLLACVPTAMRKQDNEGDRIVNRLVRFFWKLATPLHEVFTRGTDQSSVWGDVVTTIWARDGERKPYWPSLCLGVLAPPSLRQDWHAIITVRNESRLPRKIAQSLRTARAMCERSVERQGGPYFLVEFLGIHEFGWMKVSHILDFETNEDPNQGKPPSQIRKRFKQLLPMAHDEIKNVTEHYNAMLDGVYDG